MLTLSRLKYWILCFLLVSSFQNFEGINMTPEYLYKIVSVEQWEASQCENQVVISSMDIEFIHLAMEEQVSHVAEKFWTNQDHVILKIDPKKLIGCLVYETNPGGKTYFYHLYEGTIPLDAIVSISIVKNY